MRNKKPILCVQKSENSKNLAFDFCYSALLGAEYMGHKVKTFKDVSELSGDPYNIIVGSVEQCSKWLSLNNYKIPETLYREELIPFLRRSCEIMHIDCARELAFPYFIKPYDQIKAFTGFVAHDKLILDIFSEGYSGNVIVQEPIDIVSEYRIYVHNNKVIDMKHYAGDWKEFPSDTGKLIRTCFQCIPYKAFTIDVGVYDGSMCLIECNDMWAIGNYGLEPKDYYLAIKDRWLQITGILK